MQHSSSPPSFIVPLSSYGSMKFEKHVLLIESLTVFSSVYQHFTAQALFMTPDWHLCVITLLTEYLQRTLNTHGTCTSLLMMHGKPKKASSHGTIHTWTREVLISAGVDMAIFTPDSTRSASMSKVVSKLMLATILKTVC